jgi:hypothetical protein
MRRIMIQASDVLTVLARGKKPRPPQMDTEPESPAANAETPGPSDDVAENAGDGSEDQADNSA